MAALRSMRRGAVSAIIKMNPHRELKAETIAEYAAGQRHEKGADRDAKPAVTQPLSAQVAEVPETRSPI
jgi:hypothetical protein